MVEYVGFDVSKEETAFCVKDKDRKVLARGKADQPQEGLRRPGPQAGGFVPAYAAPPARRSALTLHRMLMTGEAFRWPPKEENATA